MKKKKICSWEKKQLGPVKRAVNWKTTFKLKLIVHQLFKSLNKAELGTTTIPI